MRRITLLFILTVFIAEIYIGTSNEFNFYWNIPSFMCKKYNITFEMLTERYGIFQNENDSFRGENITILYDPGEFPAILKVPSSNKLVLRNHGVPQRGNLSKHFEILTQEVVKLIPSSTFSGIAIIDFESWRPIYRQNFGTLLPYKILSIQLEQKDHPTWCKKRIEKEAKRNFEIGAEVFMLETLKLLKKMRPNANWGYYSFPFCFNTDATNADECAKEVKVENNMIQWLFQSSDVIFPSVYLQEQVNPKKRISIVKGRVLEAIRVAKMANRGNKPKVFVYHRYVYTDTLKYLESVETFNLFKQVKQLGANGVILWGSSHDLNTRKKCQEFQMYVEEKFGPVIRMLSSN